MQRELEVLSEQYSQKCLENAHLAQALEAERQALRQCQRENQELNAHNQVRRTGPPPDVWHHRGVDRSSLQLLGLSPSGSAAGRWPWGLEAPRCLFLLRGCWAARVQVSRPHGWDRV